MESKTFVTHKALVALDMSEADVAVLAYLRFWAQEIALHQLHFLHVVQHTAHWSAWLPWNKKAEQADWNTGNATILQKQMETAVCNQFQNMPAVLSYEVKEGNPLQQILEGVERNHVDLLVLGRKTTPDSHGILAHNAVRKTTCPVLVIPQNTIPELKTIVVPIDFSVYSAKALQTALALNERLRQPAKIIALHLYELPNIPPHHIQKSEAQLRESIAGDVQEALSAFVRHHAGNFYDLVGLQLIAHTQGTLAGTLLGAVGGAGADLVLMGAKGHSLVERLLLGSVTERFLQLNKEYCTLIVR